MSVPSETTRRYVLWGSVAAVVLAALTAGIWFSTRGGGGGSAIETRPVGPLRLGVVSDPDVPGVGDNDLVLRVETPDGEPVRDAEVEAVIFMPAMGAMPYMESRPDLEEKKPGRYEGTYNLIMGGSWDVDVRVKPPSGELVQAGLRLTVGTPGMNWVTETAADGDTGTVALPGAIQLSATRRQEIGVTTAAVEKRDLSHVRRTVGRVTYDETRRAEVNLKFSGWVRSLRADFTGRPVRRGEVLFTVYSPDLYSAQREFVQALAVADSLPEGPAKRRAVELAAAARERLRLWDLTPGQVSALERTRTPQEAIAVHSPVSGVIQEMNVVAGSAVEPGMTLYRIAPLDPVWVLADVFQYELPFLRVGQEATVSMPYGEGAARHGRITYVYPYLAGATRTGQVRVEVANPGLALKPDMFVDVELKVPLGERLAVPVSAVIFSGERRVVFVDRGGGRLEPVTIEVGPKAGEWLAVESGLEAGDVVVTSGNFLISAESRLRSATSRW